MSKKVRPAVVIVGVLFCVALTSSNAVSTTHATPTLVQYIANSAATTSSVTTTTNVASANNLLVVICGDSGSVTLTGPLGFTSAINETGTASQAIFYKLSVGTESTFTCTANNASYGMATQVYEYSGVNYTAPFDAVNTTSSTGNSTSYGSGTVATTSSGDVVLASFMLSTGTTVNSWSNSFIQELTGGVGSGKTSSRFTYGSADILAGTVGSYSTIATGTSSGTWLGQIIAFRTQPTPVLSVDVVNGTGTPVASPSVSFGTQTTSFGCQTATATLGTTSQKIRISNTTTNTAWTVSLAATGGNTSKWTAGSNTYSYNNPTSAGCSAGQLSVSLSGATLTPSSGCTNTGVSIGSNTAFSKAVVDAATLASSSTSATTNCSWDITSAVLSQALPPELAPGSYSLGLTITVVAN